MKTIEIFITSDTKEDEIDMILLANIHEENINLVLVGFEKNKDMLKKYSDLYNIPMRIIE